MRRFSSSSAITFQTFDKLLSDIWASSTNLITPLDEDVDETKLSYVGSLLEEISFPWYMAGGTLSLILSRPLNDRERDLCQRRKWGVNEPPNNRLMYSLCESLSPQFPEITRTFKSGCAP